MKDLIKFTVNLSTGAVTIVPNDESTDIKVFYAKKESDIEELAQAARQAVGSY